MAPGEQPPRMSTDSTTISSEVLNTIARMAVLGVAGVHGLGTGPLGVKRVFGSPALSGIQLRSRDGEISGEIYVVVQAGHNLREVCRLVQNHVARALQQMAGLTIGAIDIHVEDIAYDKTGA